MEGVRPTGQPEDRVHAGRLAQVGDPPQKGGDAPAQRPNGEAAHDTGQIEQEELDHAAHARAGHAAEDDIERHDGHAHQGRSPHAHGEDGGQKGGGGDDLGDDADEDAQGAEDGAPVAGGLPIALGDDAQQGGGAAVPQRHDVAHRQKQAADPGAQCEPPGSETVTVGELGRANGGLPADQGAHDGARHQPGAGAPAAVKIRGALYAPSRVDTDAHDHGQRGQDADDVPNGERHVRPCSRSGWER